jgi:hypothetical protein
MVTKRFELPHLLQFTREMVDCAPRTMHDMAMAINYRSHFAYRIDAWDADGEAVIEHLAGVEDLQVAKATYLAACQRWPGTPITLRQGTRVIEDSRQTRLV